MYLFPEVYTDECVIASNMLDCGMKKAPNVTGNMIAAGMGPDNIVSRVKSSSLVVSISTRKGFPASSVP